MIKKMLAYPVMLSSILLLAACSDKPNEETMISPKADGYYDDTEVQAESTETEEENRIEWAALTQEEKEKMVLDALDSSGYSGYPAEEVIEVFDDKYALGYYMESDFIDEFNGILETELKELKFVDGGNQYGNDSFTEYENSKVSHVFEKDGKVFVLHGFSEDPLLSIAENGIWIVKDVLLFAEGDEGAVNNALTNIGLNPDKFDFYSYFSERVLFHEDHVYMLVREKQDGSGRDTNNVIIDFLIGEKGAEINGAIQNVPYDPVFLKTSKGKLAFMKHTEDQVDLYYVDDNDNPIATYKPSHAFRNIISLSTNTYDRVYLYEDSGIMYVGDSTLFKLDTKTGEPVWDADGQEVQYDLNVGDSYVYFYTEDLLGVANKKSNTFTLYDENLSQKGQPMDLYINLQQQQGFMVSSNNNNITFWSQKEFEGKPSLYYEIIRKGIDEYLPAGD
jgi:hypothetical protein